MFLRLFIISQKSVDAVLPRNKLHANDFNVFSFIESESIVPNSKGTACRDKFNCVPFSSLVTFATSCVAHSGIISAATHCPQIMHIAHAQCVQQNADQHKRHAIGFWMLSLLLEVQLDFSFAAMLPEPNGCIDLCNVCASRSCRKVRCPQLPFVCLLLKCLMLPFMQASYQLVQGPYVDDHHILN